MAGTRTMGSTFTLKKKDSETEDTKIAHLTSIGEVSGEREEIDVTDLDSPNGAKEFISGAVDWGTVEIEGNVNDATQLTKLRSIFDGQDTREWEVATPAGNKLTFTAFIQSLTYGEKTTDGLDTFKATLRVSGSPTFTPASA